MRIWKLLLGPLLALALIAGACGGDDDEPADGADTGGETIDATDDEGTTDEGAADDEPADEGATDAADEGTTDEGAAPVERAPNLTLAMAGTLPGWEVPQSQYGNANLYYQAVYDGLLRIETDGRTVTPHLATEWSYNDDQTVLTMTLRDDVTFSDGTAFTADIAAQNLIRFRDGNGSDASNLLAMADAVAIDDTTLEITLSAPDPAFLNYMARNAGLMQNPASFDTADASPEALGSGPYVLDTGRTVPDSEYVFVAREDYWAPETVYYDELTLRVIDDGTASVNALRAGEVNGANLVNRDAAPEIEAAGFDLHTQELNWVGLSLIDRDGVLGSPLDNKLVRQAINHAFDREAILAGFGGGFGEVTQQVFAENSAGFDPALDERYPYDLELAQELMAESGVGEFTMTMPAAFGFFGEAIYAIVADSLAEIGITVEYEEPADFIADLLAPKYPAYFMFLEQNPNDWQFINFLIAPTAVFNPGGATDATVEGLVADIQASPAGDERDALILQLGQHVSEEAWYAPMYRQTNIFATDGDTDVTPQEGNAVPYLWNFVPQS